VKKALNIDDLLLNGKGRGLRAQPRRENGEKEEGRKGQNLALTETKVRRKGQNLTIHWGSPGLKGIGSIYVC